MLDCGRTDGVFDFQIADETCLIGRLNVERNQANPGMAPDFQQLRYEFPAICIIVKALQIGDSDFNIGALQG